MIAEYDGRCGICQQSIRGGLDEIVKLDGEWCHQDCYEGDEAYDDDEERYGR